jgi:hypothetical protein
VVEPLVALILILANYRLARLATVDQITAPLRERIWKRFPPSTQFGYLWTCMWCTSVWTAILLVLCYILIPVPTTIIAAILALSAAVGILDTVVEK